MTALACQVTRSILPRLGDTFLSVVAPDGAADLEPTFARVACNGSLYDKAIARIQQFRGRVYREDGAIPQSALQDSGRHWSELDYRSWHLLATNARGRILGCMRYSPVRTRPLTVDSLYLTQALRRADGRAAERARPAIQHFLDCANRRGAGFCELGGWAISAQARNSSKTLILTCAVWALGVLLDDLFGLATVTTRHHSSQILRYLSGFPLESEGGELPAFFDPHYGCALQILAFVRLGACPRYPRMGNEILARLRHAPVLVP